MNDTQTDRDELMALLALGVIASLVALFQLSQANILNSIVSLPPPTPLELWFEHTAELLTFGLFGGYLAFVTLAVAFENTGITLVSPYFRRVSAMLFVWGAFSLFILAFVFTVRIFS